MPCNSKVSCFCRFLSNFYRCFFDIISTFAGENQEVNDGCAPLKKRKNGILM